MSRGAVGAWRFKYGCREPLCNRHKVFGRDYCALHDRPDEQIARERWAADHPGEQLPCAGCSHRRIFHFMMTGGAWGSRKPRHEEPCRCSIPDCACLAYSP